MFLAITLRDESLTRDCSEHRERLLGKIEKARNDYPQLQMRESYRIKGEMGPDLIDVDSVKTEDVETEDIYEIIEAKEEFADSTSLHSASYNLTSSRDKISTDTVSVTSSAYHTESNSLPCEEVIPLAFWAGYLEKKKENKVTLKRYARRYCVIYQDSLLIYERISDNRAREQYILSKYDVRESAVYSSSTTSSKSKELCFDLVSPGDKTITFMASSKDEMDLWIRKINEIKQSLIRTKEDLTEDDDGYGDSKEESKREADGIGDEAVDEPLYNEAETEISGLEGKLPFSSGTENDTSGRGIEDGETGVRATPTSVHVGRDTGEGSSSSSGHGSDESEGEEIDYENWYIGKWTCKADSEDELDFKRGDLIHIISREYDNYGWWIGKLNGHGKIGLVPKNYLMEAYELIC